MQAKNLFDLSGRVALITGASTQGIGSEAAKFLAENHAKVFLVARREDRLKEIAETIRSFGGEAATMPATYPVKKPVKQRWRGALPNLAGWIFWCWLPVFQENRPKQPRRCLIPKFTVRCWESIWTEPFLW